MDSVDHIEEMRQVRQAVGKKVTMNTSTVSQYNRYQFGYLGAESDFESSAFANSATPALGVKRIRDSRVSSTLPRCRLRCPQRIF